ncbi:hypothetical protein CRYUN_Cryun23aG0045400 [Craigia yunnanensis]
MREKLKLAGHVPDTSQVLLCIEEEEEKKAELENHSERLAIAFGLINVEAGYPICIMKNLRLLAGINAFFNRTEWEDPQNFKVFR